MSIYVDDNFMLVTKKCLMRQLTKLNPHLTSKFKTEENDYLGCNFLVLGDNKKGWLGQPHMIKSLSKKFGHLTEKCWKQKHMG